MHAEMKRMGEEEVKWRSNLGKFKRICGRKLRGETRGGAEETLREELNGDDREQDVREAVEKLWKIYWREDLKMT